MLRHVTGRKELDDPLLADEAWALSGPVLNKVPLLLGLSTEEEPLRCSVERWSSVVPVLRRQQSEQVLLSLGELAEDRLFHSVLSEVVVL
jgi:hypothetical protein